ncbi:MAG: carbamoyltransferase, partial [Phycisphaeraceae bacterium]
MSVILGLNFFHADSSACVVVDGVLKSAIAEERLGERLKHDPRFPENAIRRALAESGVRLQDVTHLAIPRDAKANSSAKMKYVLTRPKRGVPAAIEHMGRRKQTAGMRERLAVICGVDPAQVKFEEHAVEHHLSHVASSYYCSPFDGLTAGLSYDASGDFVSMMAARCEGTKIEILDRVYLPHSLGFFYTAICQYIGFTDFGEEYKVMGLAPYGEDKYGELMAKLLRIDESGWFRLNEPCFGMHSGGESGEVDTNKRIVMGRLYTEQMEKLIGMPARKRSDSMEQMHKDLARSCQVRFEEAAVHCMKRLHALVPTERVAYAGGCALNGVANARILRETGFRDPFLQCAASDDGTCIGAALWVYHNVLGGKNRFHMEHAYWGPGYSEEEEKKSAEQIGMPMRACSGDETLRVVAKLINEGLVVGWYQGGSEWGPRALGNRSILANPTRKDMKDIINTKIKRRESFRPFAPTVLKEKVNEYFEQDVHSPFMMHVVKIRQEWREKLPAVTHVDGTGRLQSIERRNNPRYYDLIEKFAELSGVAVVLNTSFNENEPIVDTPDQAAACFTRTDMDALCLGDHVVVKPEHE